MKTTSKIFAAFFYLLSAVSFYAVLAGATHQLFMMAISTMIAVVLHHDYLKKSEPVTVPGDID